MAQRQAPWLGAALLVLSALVAAVSLPHASAAAAEASWRDSLQEFPMFAQALEKSGAAKQIDAYLASPAGARSGLTLLAPSSAAFGELSGDDAAMLRQVPWAMKPALLFHVIKARVDHVAFREAQPETKYPTLSSVPVVKIFAPILEFGPAGSPYGPQVTRANAFMSPQVIVHGLSALMDPGLYARAVAARVGAGAPLVLLQQAGGIGGGGLTRAHDGRQACAAAQAALRKRGATRFLQALQQAELLDYVCGKLEAQSLTLLVPTDDAWGNMPPAVADALAQNPQAIIQVLLFHVITSRVTAAQLRAAAPNSEFLTFSSQMLSRLNTKSLQLGYANATEGAELAAADVYGDEIVSVQILNEVLVPKRKRAISR
eukprot:TRINITY_DN5653_c0_g1_i1.p1 TRINITY_DN5653_c0_g1~~TRINITY_DN5653_c0_g1_i1.p1  ORF type:complete len:373 (-),score=8.03 TRINITY_DN5653_c0_g1_i1:82-1200(-)